MGQASSLPLGFGSFLINGGSTDTESSPCLCVEDRRSETWSEFLGLRCRSGAVLEVGETQCTDGLAPELESKTVDQVGCGGSGLAVFGAPLGRREIQGRPVDSEGSSGGEQEDGVGSDRKLWSVEGT